MAVEPLHVAGKRFKDDSINAAGFPMKMKRVILWIGGLATILIFILVVSALLLPRLIDSHLVKEKIASGVAQKTNGTVTLGKIDLLWFPRPTVRIESAGFSLDENTKGTIQTVNLYPSIFPLFAGRVVVRRAQLQEPKVKVRLPARSERSLDIEELEENLRSALTYFTTELPGIRLDLSDTSAVIEMGDNPPVIIENLEARIVTSPSAMSLELTARSNLCDRFHIEGKISQGTLAAELAVAVQRLKLKESLASLPRHFSETAVGGEVSFDLRIATVGLKQIKAEIDGSVGSLVLLRGGVTANIKAKRLRGNLVFEEDSIQAKIVQLDLESPRLGASAELKLAPPLSSARIEVRDVDVAEVRDLALQIAEDFPALKTLFRFLQAGTIPEIIWQSGGPSFTEMAMIKNIAVRGSLRNGRVFVPGPDLDLKNVTGSVWISGGILEAKELSGNLGATKASEGKLRLGLEKSNAPFHLDLRIAGGAAELQALVLRVVKDESVRHEISKVRNLKGELSGRVLLGERLDAITPRISVSQIAVTASYDRIRHPITVREGIFEYDDGKITVAGMKGTIGRSSFAGLSAGVSKDEQRQLEIGSGSLSLDLEQTKELIDNFAALEKKLTDVRFVQGRVEITSLTLKGPLYNPSRWFFNSAGTVGDLSLLYRDMPGPISLSRGQFAATQEKITFSDAAAAMLDASLVAGGIFEITNGAPHHIEASGTGMVGEQMTQWLSRRIELSEKLVLRSPLTIASARIDWREPDEVSFRGKLTVAGGAEISLDVARQSQRVAVRDLTIGDGARRAHMTLQLSKDNLELSFKGALEQQTLNRVFSTFPMQGSLLQGDIQVSAALQKPIRFSARGQLEGSNLLVPMAEERAMVEKFRLEGAGTNMLIRAADLRWRNSRLAVSGKLSAAKDVLRADVDVAADRIVWDEVSEAISRSGEARDGRGAGDRVLPPVEATVRLNAKRFDFAGFSWSPLRSSAVVSSNGVRGEMEQGVVCGIQAMGRFDAQAEEVGLDIRLSVTDGPLEPTSRCLTDEKTDLKGTYSLNAHIVGRGNRERLRQSLKGKFDLVARNGEFVRSPVVNAAFDYLNESGDFKMAFPDLDKEVFPYRLIRARGSVDGEILIGEEVVIQSSLITITSQGKVDLARKQVDAKGLVSVGMPGAQVIKRVPLLGPVLSGSWVGIPLHIKGSIDRPKLTYLSPADIGVEFLKVPGRVLGIPLGALQLFTPSAVSQDKSITK